MKKQLLFSLLIGCVLVSCKTTKISRTKNDGLITFKLIQLNDVYEISPLNGGKYGGMARVAHVVDSIKKETPNTYLFMAGDFLNPSLLGTLKLHGERIKGKQMIEVMNAMDFELVTFGNHEFDLTQVELQERMDRSNFYWTSANVFQNNEDGPRSFFFTRNGDTIYVPETYTIHMVDEDKTGVDIGFFGVTLDSNPTDYVYYSDVFTEAGSSYSILQSQQAEMIIGLTHLKLKQDLELAKAYPEIDLIMGGHEHNAMSHQVGKTKIMKADANAKSIYIHTITYDTNTDKSQIESYLFPIDHTISSHVEVKKIVDKWNTILEDKIKEVVANPNEVIYTTQVPLDGTDTANRSTQTNLGGYIANAMAESFHNEIEGALINGGSIRLDDVIEGEVTALDIFRVLPFGGEVVWVDINGDLLKKVLDFGESKKGTGAYLQQYGFKYADEGWSIQNQPIDDDNVYQVALSDFLLKGYDIPFLTPENIGVLSIHTPKETELAKDIRKAVIGFLQKK